MTSRKHSNTLNIAYVFQLVFGAQARRFAQNRFRFFRNLRLNREEDIKMIFLETVKLKRQGVQKEEPTSLEDL